MDRRIRIEIEVDTGLSRHQGLDLELGAQATLNQLLDVGLAALARNDLKFLGVELDIDGDAELLLPDVVLDDDLGDGADLDAPEGDGGADVEPGQRAREIEDRLALRARNTGRCRRPAVR